jgi:fatty acid synthase, bacteria type
MKTRTTAYLFTGQGTQKQGMGMVGYERSPAAKEVWDTADDFCRNELGFSLLEIVRDNPQTLIVKGQNLAHPEGVIHLTQFTQVSLCTLAFAYMAELKEKNLHDEDAMFAGHSLGEYAGLLAEGFLPLKDTIKIVYQRGLTMQNFVPRDASGNSSYRMIVVSPYRLGMTEGDLTQMVDTIAKESKGALQIVNFNVRDEQYAITGEIAVLDRLKTFLNEQGVKVGWKKRCFLELPGLDVPFHSSVLRDGVDAFRTFMSTTLPKEFDYAALVGRYVPNLNARPFALTREYLEDICALTDSPVLKEMLNKGEAALTAKDAARTILMELLAYQFASPVQWIKTQEVLLAVGGVERCIEIGPAPVLSNMARITREKMGRPLPEVLHIEEDRAKIFGV